MVFSDTSAVLESTSPPFERLFWKNKGGGSWDRNFTSQKYLQKIGACGELYKTQNKSSFFEQIDGTQFLKWYLLKFVLPCSVFFICGAYSKHNHWFSVNETMILCTHCDVKVASTSIYASFQKISRSKNFGSSKNKGRVGRGGGSWIEYSWSYESFHQW